MVATDVSYITTRDKADADAPAFKELIQIIRRQPGCHGVYYGSIQEKENKLIVITNWEDLESHGNFAQSEDWASAGAQFSQLTDTLPDVVHYTFPSNDELKTQLSAPVTEVLTLYTKDEDAKYDEGVAKFSAEVLDGAKGCHGSAKAWSIEDISHESFGDSNTGSILKCFIGWDNVDAHHATRDGQAFKDHIHLIQEGSTARDLVHVALKSA